MKKFGIIISGDHGVGKDTAAKMLQEMFIRLNTYGTIDRYQYEDYDNEDRIPDVYNSTNGTRNIRPIRFADDMKRSLSTLTGIPLNCFHSRQFKDSHIAINSSTGGLLINPHNDFISTANNITAGHSEYIIRDLMNEYHKDMKRLYGEYVFVNAAYYNISTSRISYEDNMEILLYTDCIDDIEMAGAKRISEDGVVVLSLYRSDKCKGVNKNSRNVIISSDERDLFYKLKSYAIRLYNDWYKKVFN